MSISLNAARRINTFFFSENYHGWGRSRRFFEGWYYKLVDAAEENTLALIPGVAMSESGEQHAFIQVLNGNDNSSHYHRFEQQQFKSSATEFSVEIGQNVFSKKHLSVQLPNVQGNIRFDGITPWAQPFAPARAMGWLSYLPFFQCYHNVLSLQHQLHGNLTVDGKKIDFEHGRGYLEKDWGSSFPEGWIWLQTNHFEEKNAQNGAQTSKNTVTRTRDEANGIKGVPSLMLAIGRVPFLGGQVTGFLVGFRWRGQLHTFTTQAGAVMRAEKSGNQFFIAFKNSRFRLEIEATQHGTGSLIAPQNGSMCGTVCESLNAHAQVRFYEKNNLIFNSNARNVGFEAGGQYEKLLCNDWQWLGAPPQYFRPNWAKIAQFFW